MLLHISTALSVIRLSFLKNVEKIGRIEERMAGFRLEWLEVAVGLGLDQKVKPCFSMG